MLIMSKMVCLPTNSAHSIQDICVKIMNINCNWSITLCDNYNQSIMPCVPDEVSIKSWTGPMRMFHTFTKEYINCKHTEFGIVMFENLVSG